MPSFRKLNVWKGPRRNNRRHKTLPTHKDDLRPTCAFSEKQGQSDRESSDYESDCSSASIPRSDSSSSRHTSESYSSSQPMVKKNRRSAAALARQVRYRTPRRIVQGLCWSMIFFIVGFIFFLVRSSYASTKYLETHRPVLKPQWESFEFLTRYYGGIRTLSASNDGMPENPTLEDEAQTINSTTHERKQYQARDMPQSQHWDAYAHHKSSAHIEKYGPVQECFLDEESSVRIPPLQYYEGRTGGFPDNVIGSYQVLDIPSDICFDRYGRLGPYGHGYGLRLGGTGSGQYGDTEGADAVWKEIDRVDYSKVDWAAAQRRCYGANQARFASLTNITTITSKLPVSGLADVTPLQPAQKTNESELAKTSRTAVVVRTWDSYEYREEDIMYLRALISELSLGAGGEYDVHLLVQVKNETAAIWADRTIYDSHLKLSVPEEFWGLATLWTETQNMMFYPGLEETWARGPELPVHGVYRGLMLALQYFAMSHPEYDFFWQWEMDIRYTGHFYSLFRSFDTWTRMQPRKGLWERNGRFYVPLIHGTWDDFTHMVRIQTDQGVENPANVWKGIDGATASTSGPVADKPIWGPERPNVSDRFDTDSDEEPPTTYSRDSYDWGVGEDADLITLNPIFDPEGTTWGLANDITGYNKTSGSVPRRAAIITASRMSKKLITMMHRETAVAKHHAFPEMWAPTVALQHGYKAVYVPHPMFVDREWPVPYLAAILNAGKNGATGGSKTSVFGDREHNFLGSTWYYNAGFSGNLWRRWLGLRVDNEGGEQFEMQGRVVEEGSTGVPAMKGGEGRMCLPPMLLHPVKDVDLPVEAMKNDYEETEFGPSD